MKVYILIIPLMLAYLTLTAQNNPQDEKTKQANSHYNAGVKYAQSGQLPEAIKEFTEVLNINSKDIDALYNRGVSRFNTGDKTGACEDWHRVREQGNHSADEAIKKNCVVETNVKSKLYLRIGAGYGFPLQPSAVNENLDLHYTPITNIVYEDHKAIVTTLGKGVYGSISPGYKLNKIFSVELDIGYINSATVTATEVIHYYSGNATYTDELNSQLYKVIPSVVIQMPDDNFSPYFRAGMIIAKPLIYREVNYSDYQDHTGYEKYEYTGNLSLGTSAALGCNFFLKGRTDVFIETSVNYLTFSPSQRTLQAYLVDGRDSMSVQTTYKKQTDYNDNYSLHYVIDANGKLVEDHSPNESRKAPTFYLPYSSWGLIVGVRLRF